MAEEILYDEQIVTDDQGDPKDPLGLRKKLSATKTKDDPLGLRAKLKPAQVTPITHEQALALPKIDYSKPVFQENVSESTAVPQINNQALLATSPRETLADKFENKVQQSRDKVFTELTTNDKAIENLIRKQKFEEAGRNVELPNSDMSVNGALANDVARMVKPETRPQDMPITPEEMQQKKALVANDDPQARRLLEEVVRINPSKKSEVQKSIYDLDIANALQNDPEGQANVRKVLDNSKKIEKGELVYDFKNGTLIKPLNPVQSALQGWKAGSQVRDEFSIYNKMSDAQLSTMLDAQMATNQGKSKYDPVEVPEGLVGNMLQGLAMSPATTVGGAAGSLAGPEGGLIAGSVLGAGEMAQRDYVVNLKRVYQELRAKGADQLEAIKEAKSQALHAAGVGAVEGAAFGFIGARFGVRALPKAALTSGFRNAVVSTLKGAGQTVGTAVKEGLAAGGITAAGEMYKNHLAKEAGIDRDIDEGVADAIESNLLFTLGMAGAVKAMKVGGKIYKNLLSGLSKADDAKISGSLNEMIQNKAITEEQATKLQEDLSAFKKEDSTIPENIAPEARLQISEKIKKRNELEQKMESTDKAFHPEIKEKIKAIEEEITGLSKDIVKPEKTDTEIHDIINDAVEEGRLAGVMGNVAKSDPQGFMKFVADQALGRTENGEMSSLPDAEYAVRDQYGDAIVDKAIELFPIKKEQLQIGTPEYYKDNPKEFVDKINSNLNGVSLKFAGKIEGNKGLPLDIIKNGKTIGYITMKLEDGIASPSIVRIDKEHQRQGITEDLYIQMNKALQKEGLGPLYSDKTFLDGKSGGEPAKNLWDKLVSKGHAEKIGNRYRFIPEKKSSISVIRSEERTQPTETITIGQRVLPEPKISDVENGKLYEFNTSDGLIAGVRKSPTEFEITGISAGEVGKGKGSQLFEGLINYLRKEGVNTLTTESAGEGAQKMHNKAIEKGLITEIKKDGRSATFKIESLKSEKDAIQIVEPSSVLQHTQEGTGEAGSGRERMEQGEQGEIPSGEKGTNEESNVADQEKISRIFSERPPTELSHRGLQEIANEFSLDDVKSRDRKTDVQLRKDAENQINDWNKAGKYYENVERLTVKAEEGGVLTDKERVIMEQHLATVRDRLRGLNKQSPEYKKGLQYLQRLKEAGEKTRSEAGAALRLPTFRSNPLKNVEDAYLAKMEAAGVDELTPKQMEEVDAQVGKFQTAELKAEVKTAELEAKVNEAKAETEFKKVKKQVIRKKKTAEEYKADRAASFEAAREALKKLRTGESGLSAVPLPGIRELVAIAPHVKDVLASLAEQGVTELGDAVKQLHEGFKDILEGITEKDIHNIIAGEYNEPRQPLSVLQQTLRDLRDEAKLINDLERLEAGIPPKAEKAKVQRNQKIKALRDKINEFKKNKKTEEAEGNAFNPEEIDATAKKLMDIKKRNKRAQQDIEKKIENKEFDGPEKRNSLLDDPQVKKNYPKLRKEALDAIAEKENAQHEFQLALLKDEMSKRNKGEKLRDFGKKLIATSKAILSGIDDSATFVQNYFTIISNPKAGGKAWLDHVKDAVSEPRMQRELAALHNSPAWDLIKDSGLEVLEPKSMAEGKVEEAFENNLLAKKVKIGGKEYDPWRYTGGIFERAFTSLGNNLRVNLFLKRAQQLIDSGKTFESHPEEFKSAARAINELTARGKQNKYVEQANPILTPIIWAPRMLSSTLNQLGLADLLSVMGGKKIGTEGFYRKLTPDQKWYAIGQLGKNIGVGIAAMAAASFGGAEVDYDPRSVTFGNIKAGTKSYNVFGRYATVIKTIVQATLGTRIKPGGDEQDLDSGKFGAKTRMGVIGGFFRGKMTPAAGAAFDLMEGKNFYTNQPFGVKDLPQALLEPMSVKELITGWQQDGSISLLTRFLPSFEGLKISDERDFEKAAVKSSGKKSHSNKKTNKRVTHKK